MHCVRHFFKLFLSGPIFDTIYIGPFSTIANLIIVKYITQFEFFFIENSVKIINSQIWAVHIIDLKIISVLSNFKSKGLDKFRHFVIKLQFTFLNM